MFRLTGQSFLSNKLPLCCKGSQCGSKVKGSRRRLKTVGARGTWGLKKGGSIVNS